MTPLGYEAAHEAIAHLRTAQQALEAYAQKTRSHGVYRSPWSDLALLDEIDCRADANELTVQADDAMARILVIRRDCQIDPGGYFWQAYSEEAFGLLDELDMIDLEKTVDARS